jgi:hypothetical protein
MMTNAIFFIIVNFFAKINKRLVDFKIEKIYSAIKNSLVEIPSEKSSISGNCDLPKGT